MVSITSCSVFELLCLRHRCRFSVYEVIPSGDLCLDNRGGDFQSKHKSKIITVIYDTMLLNYFGRCFTCWTKYYSLNETADTLGLSNQLKPNIIECSFITCFG